LQLRPVTNDFLSQGKEYEEGLYTIIVMFVACALVIMGVFGYFVCCGALGCCDQSNESDPVPRTYKSSVVARRRLCMMVVSFLLVGVVAGLLVGLTLLELTASDMVSTVDDAAHRSDTHTHTHPPTHTHTHTHARTRARTHTRTHTHARARTHTHTHVRWAARDDQIRIYLLSSFCL
jgi:hypothetical protein